MNIVERIKELNQRQFTESVLDDSGLVEDEPFKSVADIDGRVDYGLGMRYFI